MNRIRLFLASLMILSSSNLLAQSLEVAGYKLNTITATSGRGVFSSGLEIATVLTNGNRDLELIYQNNQAWGVHGWNLANNKLRLAATAGIFENSPWAGPQLIVRLGNFSSMHWTGWIAGAPNHPAFKNTFFTHYSDVAWSAKGIRLSYGMLKFMDGEWNRVPGISYNGKVNHQLGWGAGLDYDQLAKEPLYRMSVSWKP